MQSILSRQSVSVFCVIAHGAMSSAGRLRGRHASQANSSRRGVSTTQSKLVTEKFRGCTHAMVYVCVDTLQHAIPIKV